MADPRPQQDMPAIETKEILLWDIGLRLFHWGLALLVTATWILGKFGPDIMTLHFWGGYAVLGLLAFRLVWGLFGPGPARFGHFIYSPLAILRYVGKMFARKPSYWPGHNPLGGLVALVMLLVLVGQAATGLFADPDDYVNVGPLASYVSAAWTRFASSWHETLSWIVLALVAMHISAIGFYKIWKREDLVTPMITGRKLVKTSKQDEAAE